MKESTGAWDAGQVKMFAKQLASSDEGKAWWLLHPTLRTAIISHHVLMLVLSQRGATPVCVNDIREVRNLIEERLASHHNLKVTP